MDIQLTPTQEAAWADTQWRAAFLSGIAVGLSTQAVGYVRFYDGAGTHLATFVRDWKMV